MKYFGFIDVNRTVVGACKIFERNGILLKFLPEFIQSIWIVSHGESSMSFPSRRNSGLILKFTCQDQNPFKMKGQFSFYYALNLNTVKPQIISVDITKICSFFGYYQRADISRGTQYLFKNLYSASKPNTAVFVLESSYSSLQYRAR